MTTCPYGFRVLGSTSGARQLVDAAAAMRESAACERELTHNEAYFSAFQFGDDFREYLDSNGTVAGFGGRCWAPWLCMDIDRNDLEVALNDARRLAACIINRYQVEANSLLIFFSGCKGFHFGLPTAIWSPEPSKTFHRVSRCFAQKLAIIAGVVIDMAVYDKVRLWRAPNSRHPKTGFYKRLLTYPELIEHPLAKILELATSPATFAIPESITATSDQACIDWSAALVASRQHSKAKSEMQAGAPKLNRQTVDFINNGASEGERHTRLFSAAANLAELGCPLVLAHALLTEVALDSGLPPYEVKATIDGGLDHVYCRVPQPPPRQPALAPPQPRFDAALAALWARQGKGAPK
jgi:hypothetical protein